MPKNSKIQSILIIGSGPIVIGQACEFDYAGSQASRSLREEGIEVSLINSNPATIMTDEVVADHIYLLPLEVDSLRKILEESFIDFKKKQFDKIYNKYDESKVEINNAFNFIKTLNPKPSGGLEDLEITEFIN